MSQERNKPARGPEEAEAEAAAAPAAEAQGEAGAADLAAENADLRDRLLRAVAELENFRRRAEKERADTAKFAIAGFAREMLGVLDNLRRGLDSVSAEERKASPALATLAEGMELTERELMAALERHGISRIEALGKPFDHNLHQAMFEIEDPNQPAGICAQEIQPGYLLNGRLLRPALVGVTKGGPKADAAGSEPLQAPIANEDVARSERNDALARGAGEGEPGTAEGDAPGGDQIDTKA